MNSRAPFQVLIFPYRVLENGERMYAILRRSDNLGWQGIAGGGEANETPLFAAKRESFEEAGISVDAEYVQLESTTHLPVTHVVDDYIWGEECLLIPEYSFGVKVETERIEISNEHSEYCWVSLQEANSLLRWDSNRNALWELDTRLEKSLVHYMRKKRHRIRAAALITNNQNEILLVQHVHPQTGTEWWVPPGGGLEDKDKTIFDCANREVYEETGLTVSTEKIAYIREFQDEENESLNVEIFCTTSKFSGSLTIKNIQGNGPDEHYIKNACWFSKDALNKIVVYPEELKNDFWQRRKAGFVETMHLGRQIG